MTATAVAETIRLCRKNGVYCTFQDQELSIICQHPTLKDIDKVVWVAIATHTYSLLNLTGKFRYQQIAQWVSKSESTVYKAVQRLVEAKCLVLERDHYYGRYAYTTAIPAASGAALWRRRQEGYYQVFHREELRAVCKRTDLSDSEKVLWVWIAHQTVGTHHLSRQLAQRDIAVALGKSIDTIARGLRHLEALQFLTRHPTAPGCMQCYSIALPADILAQLNPRQQRALPPAELTNPPAKITGLINTLPENTQIKNTLSKSEAELEYTYSNSSTLSFPDSIQYWMGRYHACADTLRGKVPEAELDAAVLSALSLNARHYVLYTRKIIQEKQENAEKAAQAKKAASATPEPPSLTARIHRGLSRIYADTPTPRPLSQLVQEIAFYLRQAPSPKDQEARYHRAMALCRNGLWRVPKGMGR